jgi:hypothetical protein
MNIKVLDKLESGWIKLNWSDYIDMIKLSHNDLETIVDLVDNFKGNRSAKEIVLFRYKYLPAYITITRSQYPALLNWVYDRFIDKEYYESCKRIVDIKSKL